MNDSQIRENFHRKKIIKYHNDPNALVIDELGIKHGICRADIAIVNGRFIGFEIKSDADSLYRLNNQIKYYNAIFDHASLVFSDCHLKNALKIIPDWWGAISATRGRRGAIHFRTLRRPKQNPVIDVFSVAQLLWRTEAYDLLSKLGINGKLLRQKREILYKEIASVIDLNDLRNIVRDYMKNRANWRDQKSLSSNDGSSQPFAK